MTVIRVQRNREGKSGQPEDTTINTLYFQTAAPYVAGDLTAIAAKLDDFFNLGVAAGPTVRSFLAEISFSNTAPLYKMFDMDDVQPRVPIQSASGANPALNSTTALPSEVACCLSFRGALVSGANMGRRRGRIYVGPLNTTAAVQDTLTGQAIPATTMLNALVNGANRLKDDLALAGITWVVYSPTARGGGAAATAVTPITYAWADNAFDTQRRRGQRASTRISMTL